MWRSLRQRAAHVLRAGALAVNTHPAPQAIADGRGLAATLEPRGIEVMLFALIVCVRSQPSADPPRERPQLATGRQPSAVEIARRRIIAMELDPCAERIAHELHLVRRLEPGRIDEARQIGGR